jgi:hypothetical protein
MEIIRNFSALLPDFTSKRKSGKTETGICKKNLIVEHQTIEKAPVGFYQGMNMKDRFHDIRLWKANI